MEADHGAQRRRVISIHLLGRLHVPCTSLKFSEQKRPTAVKKIKYTHWLKLWCDLATVE